MSIRRERRQAHRGAEPGRAVFAALLADLRARRIDRREFLAKISLLLTLAPLPLVAQAATVPPPDDDTDLRIDPWRTFAAVQAHLFPKTATAPGAGDIHATAYLRGVLNEAFTDPEEREFIKNGPGWLNDIARERLGQPFYKLDTAGREQVLRQIEKSAAGERWLSLMLVYLFEALLSDPVYGGNPGGIGWRWLEHQPGFPRPPADKTYFNL